LAIPLAGATKQELSEPPHTSLGYLTDEIPTYNPFIDPDSATPEGLMKVFFAWACSYFDRNKFTGKLNDLDMRKSTSKLSQFTQDELAGILEPEVLGAEVPVLVILQFPLTFRS
jgi:hypothetical protein